MLERRVRKKANAERPAPNAQPAYAEGFGVAGASPAHLSWQPERLPYKSNSAG
jgi:hypothetical protein